MWKYRGYYPSMDTGRSENTQVHTSTLWHLNRWNANFLQYDTGNQLDGRYRYQRRVYRETKEVRFNGDNRVRQSHKLDYLPHIWFFAKLTWYWKSAKTHCTATNWAKRHHLKWCTSYILTGAEQQFLFSSARHLSIGCCWCLFCNSLDCQPFGDRETFIDLFCYVSRFVNFVKSSI